MEVIAKYDIRSPETGNPLGEPYEFNLMFPVPIGPSGNQQGYLRPETAQGIFLNYKYCLEQNGNRLPFGVAQIGRVYRNEIAPRAGLTRMREFSQCEIEWFVKPTDKSCAKFADVKHLTLLFHPQAQQLDGEDPIWLTLEKAVAEGIVDNETLGYFIGRVYLLMRKIGVKEQHLRFRQHLPKEMAHYASDCWDCEIECCLGWLECVGIADRSCFDLNAHAQATKEDLQYRETLDPPIVRECVKLSKQGLQDLMKVFGKKGKQVRAWYDSMQKEDPTSFGFFVERVKKAGSVMVAVDCDTNLEFTPSMLQGTETENKKITTLRYTPGVIEPSLGVDRVLFCLWEHCYYARPAEGDEKATRGVLAIPPALAPYKVIILPVDQRISRDARFHDAYRVLRTGLTRRRVAYTLDDAASATIGKRYARNDELGIPYAVTMDQTTFEDGTATLRERDSMKQVRVNLQDLPELVSQLCLGLTDWDECSKRFPANSQ